MVSGERVTQRVADKEREFKLYCACSAEVSTLEQVSAIYTYTSLSIIHALRSTCSGDGGTETNCITNVANMYVRT